MMDTEFKSIVLLLTTQAMINLGEISDPLNNKKNPDKKNSQLFISLLKELKKKTDGNLSESEDLFLEEVLVNLSRIFRDKFDTGKVQ